MKKSTIILLLVVFLGSVFIVGIFGLESIPYKEIIYTEAIEITSLTYFDGVSNVDIPSAKIGTNSSGERYISIPYNDQLSIFVNAMTIPNDATNTALRITATSNSTDIVANTTEQGLIEVRYVGTNANASGSIVVTLRATDSPNAPSVKLRIRFTAPKN